MSDRAAALYKHVQTHGFNPIEVGDPRDSALPLGTSGRGRGSWSKTVLLNDLLASHPPTREHVG
jgi:hypothetical protein